MSLRWWFVAIFPLIFFEDSLAAQSPFFARHKHFKLLTPPTFAPGDILPKQQWFVQKLDHSNPSDSRMWKQRYFTNDQYFDANNPKTVFLLVGGEGEASAKWMTAGSWIDYAKKFKALCFQLEHRFYGKSQPTDNLNIKNLQFLTSEMALADIANFIQTQNENLKLPSDVKWVLFGGSYPGALVAWARLKYPHLVHAAVSSSAPLLAKVDFGDYYKVVVESLRTSGDDCVDKVKEGFQDMSMLLSHRVGQRSASTKFRLCDSIEGGSDLDLSSFYEAIASNFAGIVQYNKDNRITNNTKVPKITIDVACRMMTDQAAGSAIDRLANLNSLLLDATDEKCLDVLYNKVLDGYKYLNFTGQNERQWMFQTCNEFGFYQTSTGEPEIFTKNFPVNFFIQQCIDLFGKKYNADFLDNAVRRTNWMYGDLNIQSSRIVFIQGSIDPWHALGITKTQESDCPAIYISGTAHCANMYPAKEDDLPDLMLAREQVNEFLGTWLAM